ncbi:carbohydrate-binding module family 50 protein [Auriscalpium vulgare]|uniref:Carbohydrate-binding module family 50 protein n=1 Tax=Auriscalpium vulgare TaxID=40419 RepID=A0ACB8RPH0_9AGAM|nr:carbohydrate-binding module family 50 protein [Auriscalpium vulgare]
MLARSVIAALAGLPILAQSVFAADCARNYTVVQGDVCDSISAAHNVSTYQLAVANPQISDDCGNLVPGDNLCLGWAGEDCTTTYVVKQDDSIEAISGAAGVNSTVFLLNNPQIDSDGDNLYIGEVVCTSTSVQVPAKPADGKVPGSAIPSSAAPAKATAAPAKATATPISGNLSDGGDGDDDDDDLPWCDEI